MSFAICTLVFLANENFISSFALHQFPLNCNQVVRDLCKFLKYWMDCLREWIYECNLFGAKVNKFWRRNRSEISLRYVACWTEFHYIWWRCFSSKCSSSCKVKKTTNKIWDLMQKKNKPWETLQQRFLHCFPRQKHNRATKFFCQHHLWRKDKTFGWCERIFHSSSITVTYVQFVQTQKEQF